MDRVFIIAEAGVNHNGSLKLAKRLVDVAARTGCDAVKFQAFKAEKLAAKSAPKAEYQRRNTGRRESQFSMLKRLEMSHSDNTALARYCRQKGIMFMSTPFDEDSVDMLDMLGMKIFKIPSGEITNRPFIRHVASKRKSIILSTGMSDLREVEKAVRWIKETWPQSAKPGNIILLHCVSRYPAVMRDVNLLAMKTMGSVFGLSYGYSDHTLGIEVAVAAVGAGAVVIEKHFTLDRDMEGPDHRVSLEPRQLADMVKSIRNVEKAMGDGIKKPAKSELVIRKIVRKSLIAARDIKAGEIVKAEDIFVKRPGTGMSPELFEEIVNKRILVDIRKDSLFKQVYF